MSWSVEDTTIAFSGGPKTAKVLSNFVFVRDLGDDGPTFYDRYHIGDFQGRRFSTSINLDGIRRFRDLKPEVKKALPDHFRDCDGWMLDEGNEELSDEGIEISDELESAPVVAFDKFLKALARSGDMDGLVSASTEVYDSQHMYGGYTFYIKTEAPLKFASQINPRTWNIVEGVASFNASEVGESAEEIIKFARDSLPGTMTSRSKITLDLRVGGKILE